jgi:hypothetical protein
MYGDSLREHPRPDLRQILINLDGVKHVLNRRCVPAPTLGSRDGFVIEGSRNGIERITLSSISGDA